MASKKKTKTTQPKKTKQAKPGSRKEPAPPPKETHEGHCKQQPSPRPSQHENLLPYPMLSRADFAGRGQTVTVEVDASNAGAGHRYYRADIELIGVDHAGATYEGRIFINKPRANSRTPLDPQNGYAGSYYIFGHGQCFGDSGHCDVPTGYRAEDKRRVHHLDATIRRINATAAIRLATLEPTRKRKQTLKITIVPVIRGATRETDLDHVVRFERLQLVTYNS